MQKIFSHGMLHELHMSQEMIDRIFPKLNDLLDIHLTFLHSLLDRQRMRPDRSIENIGDVIVQQVCASAINIYFVRTYCFAYGNMA